MEVKRRGVKTSPIHKPWAAFPPAPTSQPPPLPHNIRRDRHPSPLTDRRSSSSDHHHHQQHHMSDRHPFSAGQRMVAGSGTRRMGTVVLGSDHVASKIPAPRGTKQMTTTASSQKLGVQDARRKANSSLVLSPPVSSPSSSSSSESSSTTPTNELGERGSPAGASSSSIVSMASQHSKPEPGQTSGSNSSTLSLSPSRPRAHSESVAMSRHHESQPLHLRSPQRETLKTRILYGRPPTKNDAHHYEARYTHSLPIRDDLQSSSSDTSLLSHQRQKITITSGLPRSGSVGESRIVQPGYKWGQFRQKQTSVVASRIAQFSNSPPPPNMPGGRMTRSSEEGRSAESHAIVAAAEHQRTAMQSANVAAVGERKVPEGVSRTLEEASSTNTVLKAGQKQVAEDQNQQQHRTDLRKLSDSYVMQVKNSEKQSPDHRRGSEGILDHKKAPEGYTEQKREPENVSSESSGGSMAHGYRASEQQQHRHTSDGPLQEVNDRGNDSHSRAMEERRTAVAASSQDSSGVPSKLHGMAPLRHQKQQHEPEEVYQQQQQQQMTHPHGTSREESVSPTSSVEELSMINQTKDNPDGWAGPARMHPEHPLPSSAQFLAHQVPPSHPQIPPPHAQIPPSHSQIPPSHPQAPPTHSQVPPSHSQVQPSHLQVSPSHSQVLPSHSQVPPSHIQISPSHSQVPPSLSQVPPSLSQVPPSHHQASPSHSQVPPPHSHPLPHSRMYASSSSQGQHATGGTGYVTHSQVVPGPHHTYPGMPPLSTHPVPYSNPHQLYQQPAQLPPGIPYSVEQLERRDHYNKVRHGGAPGSSQPLGIMSANIALAHTAAASGDVMLLHKLLATGDVDPLSCDEHEPNSTLLHKAAAYGHLPVMKLVAKDVPQSALQLADSNYLTPAMLAIQGGHLEFVKWLIEEKNVPLTVPDAGGETLLHHAAFHGQLKCLEYLLSRASNNSVAYMDESGVTPAHFAAQRGHLDCLRLLISRGFDVTLPDREHQKPSDWADAMGQHSCTHFLLMVELCWSLSRDVTILTQQVETLRHENEQLHEVLDHRDKEHHAAIAKMHQQHQVNMHKVHEKYAGITVSLLRGGQEGKDQQVSGTSHSSGGGQGGSATGASTSAGKTSESTNKKRVKIIPEPLQIREIPVEIDMKATTPHEVLKRQMTTVEQRLNASREVRRHHPVMATRSFSPLSPLIRRMNSLENVQPQQLQQAAMERTHIVKGAMKKSNERRTSGQRVTFSTIPEYVEHPSTLSGDCTDSSKEKSDNQEEGRTEESTQSGKDPLSHSTSSPSHHSVNS